VTGPFRVGFAGTPSFAATALDAIVDGGFDVAMVMTRPDAASGRGLKLAASAVKSRAVAHSLAVLQPASLRDAGEISPLLETTIDVLVVAAYGLVLPSAVLAWPRLGCINIHASLLPRWRGAAPIVRCLLAGDLQTGVTIMQMDEGLDTGPMIARREVAVSARETARSLHDILAALGAGAIVETLGALRSEGRIQATPQPAEGVTYAAKIRREEATIDWRESALVVDRVVRAFDPVPGAQTRYQGATLKIWRADPASGGFGDPGSVISANTEGLVVACGEGALIVREVQLAGARRMSTGAFLAGRRVAPGARLGA